MSGFAFWKSSTIRFQPAFWKSKRPTQPMNLIVVSALADPIPRRTPRRPAATARMRPSSRTIFLWESLTLDRARRHPLDEVALEEQEQGQDRQGRHGGD